jgi:hypothetical protein
MLLDLVKMADKMFIKEEKPLSPVASEDVDLDSDPSQSYAFGAEGKSLTRQIAIAGAIGFLLFGYDQGVLGVSQSSPPNLLTTN